MNEKKEEIQKAANRLRLGAIAKYETYIDPQRPFEDNLLCILQEQVLLSDEQKFNRRIRNAGFPQLKTFDTFVMSDEHLPFLNFDELRELKTCAFIEDKNDIVAVGPAGRGKTHIALAIAYEAVKNGYSVRFKRASDLVNEMSEAKNEKQLSDYIRNLNRCQLLVIDEVGYLNYDINASSLLFQVVSTRYEKGSTIYTTN